ncbi:hypothetical protein STRIP9103_09614, partial [Streptomyces ipomoeae 91-03]
SRTSAVVLDAEISVVKLFSAITVAPRRSAMDSSGATSVFQRRVSRPVLRKNTTTESEVSRYSSSNASTLTPPPQVSTVSTGSAPATANGTTMASATTVGSRLAVYGAP